MAGKRFPLPVLALVPALVLVAAFGAACSAVSAAVTPASAPPNIPTLFSDTNQKPSINPSAEKTVLRTRYVTVNLSPFQAGGGPESVKKMILNLFPDVYVTASLDRIDRPSPNGFVWVGHVDGVANSQVTLAVQDNVMMGAIVIPNNQYQVRFMGNGVHAINQINQAAFPPD